MEDINGITLEVGTFVCWAGEALNEDIGVITYIFEPEDARLPVDIGLLFSDGSSVEVEGTHDPCELAVIDAEALDPTAVALLEELAPSYAETL